MPDMENISAMGLLALAWFWWFVIAPGRAYEVGMIVEDPPISLKMGRFKAIKFLALIALLALGYVAPWDVDLTTLNYVELATDVATFSNPGPLLAILSTLILLWGIPTLNASRLAKKEEDPGGWLTPALTFYRWFWLGLVLVITSGYFESLGLTVLRAPLDPGVAVALGIIGAIIYVLWWGMPAMKVGKAAAGGDPRAIGSVRNVRWSGLPAYVRYAMGGAPKADARGDAGAQKLCASCMRPIDDLDNYESLRFDVCPHCGEVIPPVFTVADYVKALSRRFSETQSAKGGKPRKPGKGDSDLTQRILRGILTLAVRERGTDLHIGGEGENAVVRCRTDGVLFPLLELPDSLLKMLVSSIKVQASLDIAEKRKPQDGTFTAIVDEKKLDIRINTSPSAQGETISMRLLYRQKIMGSLEHLGMSLRNFSVISDLITRPHGLILVTGPTGSGKTTTLYNSLGSIADGRRNIVTLEDPIEFKIDGLNQMQIDASKGFTFASGLRSILRQDPDVIMVGEIRDGETAKMAIDAANTGHLVFSTLHTIDTSATLGRLADLNIDPHRNADALLAIVAQRLVRLNCNRCLEDYELTREALTALKLEGGPEKLRLKRGVGCERCHHTGYFEREGIYELFVPDTTVRKAIADRLPIADVRRAARKRGMRTMLEDGLIKVILGRTSVEEVLRVTS